MNLILLHPQDFTGEREVRLAGRRATHVREVHRAEPGRSLKVGLANGKMGTGIVMSWDGPDIMLEVSLLDSPPPPLPVTLLLAMPRPKGFRRIIQGAVTMGVKRIALFGAYRVEKSYWQSPWLEPDALREQVCLGLEQGGDTLFPEITLHPLFKPFVEDVVPDLTLNTLRLVAHPDGGEPCPASVSGPVSLIIGPEGGFTAFELSALGRAGFEAVTLGPRILKTEQAVPAFLGRFISPPHFPLH